MENENYKGVDPSSEEQQQNNSRQPVEDEMDEEAAAKERLTSDDPTKVVFLSANSEYTRKNGDAKVDIENVQRSVGMGKEELLKYANEPFWVRLRMTLFVLFWIVWLAMLIGSVAIIVVVPGCPASPNLEWWQKTTIYQVVVGSFKDSDGDKRGDLNGLSSKLDYFSDLRLDTLLLSSVFESAGPHTPNEVTNFTDIAPHFGTFTDFKNFIAKADEKNMKVILEFIPNHTSDKHPWFIKSANGEEPYTDYYVWKASKEGSDGPDGVPNNWVSLQGGSAWTWSPQRKMFYLHQHHSGLPDLNLRNTHLRQNLQEILVFWLNEGVDGFKVMDVDFLFEDEALQNEATGSEDGSLVHDRTRGQAENLEILREWREVLSNYTETAADKHQRILLTETASDGTRSGSYYYGDANNTAADIPYSLSLTSLTVDSTPADLHAALQQNYNSTPQGLWPNYVLGTSQQSRLLSRVGSSLLDGIHMVTLLSNGTPVVYYGDELGLEGGPHAGDHGGAEPELMPWDNTTSPAAGGDVGQPDHVTVTNEMDKPHSHLSIFRHLLLLREKPAVSFGVMEFPLVNNQIFSMLRVKKGTPGYLVVINFSGNGTAIDFSGLSPLLPEIANVELATPVPDYLKDANHPKISLSNVEIGPHQSAVLTFVPQNK